MRFSIGLAGWHPLCGAGIRRTLKGPDGTAPHATAMITLSADKQPVMRHMHRPGDENRSVMILRPDDREEWLTRSNVEAACDAADLPGRRDRRRTGVFMSSFFVVGRRKGVEPLPAGPAITAMAQMHVSLQRDPAAMACDGRHVRDVPSHLEQARRSLMA